MCRRTPFAALLVVALACSPKPRAAVAPATPPPEPTVPAVELDALEQGQTVRGFRTVAVYLDGAEAPIGARFVHEKTGFVFDYLRIESAPQGFVWVNSFPTSDKGEPHTQEHLLLGKGNRGRRFASVEAMSLGDSSAFTMQWRTCYHFHTIAGHDVFWPVFENQLDALLDPDYTDEEIRREVRNFGVSQEPDGSLRLEEKGTVYNEMVRTYESADNLLWQESARTLYGPTHPLALSSGGEPAAIRSMTPEDIRAFHREHYYLGNMGMVGAFPGSMALGDVLDRTGKILDQRGGRTGHAMTEANLPAPQSKSAGAAAVIDYPYADTAQASPVQLFWPATRKLDLVERTLLQLFMDAVAGDESTNLYKRLVDSKTRTLDVGATGVWSYVSTDQGQPVYVGVDGVAARALDDKGLADIRAAVADELARIAALPAGAPELVALDQRVASRLTDLRRRLGKFLNSPPGFGFRGTGSGWMEYLRDLEQTPDFKKSLTMKHELVKIEEIIADKGNPWSARLKAWGLLETPYGLAARPSPSLRQKLDADRKARIDAELARLTTSFGTRDAKDTLARFRTDYDKATEALESGGKTAMPPFVDSPPMSLDDELQFATRQIAGGVPVVASRIDTMTGGTVGIGFRLDAVAEDDLPLLALLPTLLTDSGLFLDGKAIPSEEVKEAQRREILYLSMYYATNPRTGRVELLAQGAGNDLAETRRALGWIGKLAGHPDWRVDNLPRLRDVVDQAITANRNVMVRAEESWVDDPPTIYWRQRWPLFAHTSSFLTKRHDLHRLRWMLADPGDAKVTAAVATALRALAPAGAKLDRAKLDALAQALERAPKKPDKALAAQLAPLAKLAPPARALVVQAGKDLRAILADIPDEVLAADWAYLCKQMATDLEAGAAPTLERLDKVRRAVLDAANARVWLVGSTANGDALGADLDALLTDLGRTTPTRQTYKDRPFIVERLRARLPAAAAPVFVGLVNPSTSSGVFVNSAPGTSFLDDRDDALLDYLASNLYSGRGGHSIFMKTWAAGLAYSNGLRISISQGRVRYYAERCPELPQTLRFVIGELEKARPDPGLVDYAVAESFSSRAAASYEDRARGIADDLTDGIGPDVVRAFRKHVLALRARGDLTDQLFGRMKAVYGKVLPGYGKVARGGADNVYFVIGPTAQLDAWQRYLQTAEGNDAVLYRLYPRDFWVPAAVK